MPVHYVRESSAAEVFPEILDESDDSIVLDIDEDYYGVMKGTDSVSSVDFEDILELNTLLKQFLLIKNVKGIWAMYQLNIDQADLWLIGNMCIRHWYFQICSVKYRILQNSYMNVVILSMEDLSPPLHWGSDSHFLNNHYITF